MSPLLRAAQLNLIVPARERRQRERDEREHYFALKRDAEQFKRDELKRKRARIKFLRDELRNLDDGEKDVRADTFYNSSPALLQGALEELDSQREKIDRELNRLEYY